MNMYRLSMAMSFVCLFLSSCFGGGDHHGQTSWIFYMRDVPQQVTLSIEEQGYVSRTRRREASSQNDLIQDDFLLSPDELEELYRLTTPERLELYELDSQGVGYSVTFLFQDGRGLSFATRNVEALSEETQELVIFFSNLEVRSAEAQ